MPEEDRLGINEFFERERPKLLPILRQYILRTGLNPSGQATSAASELLNELVVEVLQHPERFYAARVPKAWVLGVALNLIRRHLAERQYLNQREPLLHDLYDEDALAEDDLIDHFVTAAETAHALEEREALALLFAHTSKQDEHLLRLAVLHEFDSDALALELGITPGAVRVRLHRALKRIRQFWGTRKRMTNYE